MFSQKQTPEQYHQFKLLIFAGLFIMGVVIANIVAVKLVEIGPFIIPAGTFIFTLTFMCIDIIAEGWGKPMAKKVIWAGFIANFVALGFIRLAMWLPPAYFYAHNEAFITILGGNMRLVIVGLLVYILSQRLDVWVFFRIRAKTGSKHLWLRNSLSAAVSQVVDTSLFIVLAFAGTVPNRVLLSMILPTVLFKWLVVVADTPLCYLGVWWVKKTCPKGGDVHAKI